MKTLVLASMNKHKSDEISAILNDYTIEPISNYTDTFVVVENGDSYEMNALKKARAAYKIAQKAVIADDSGLNVEALDNGPGIYSARFLGEDTSYELKNQTIINVCAAKNNFNASFTCVIAYIDDTGNETLFRYDLAGKISNAICGSHGFGYDPIFIPNDQKQTMAELPEMVKNKISHRYNALEKLAQFLNKTIQPTSNKIHVVLYEPEIPQNTGNIMRTCAAINAKLHLIKPLGFRLDEARMRRSGMDYIDLLDYQVYENWEDFTSKNPSNHYYFLTRYGKKTPTEFNYPQTEDVYFVLGKESTGIDKKILKNHLDHCMRLPMQKDARSLNLSNCAAIIVYEALRQFDYRGLKQEEVLKGSNFLETWEE